MLQSFKVLILIIFSLSFRVASAGCSAFSLEDEKPNISIIVQGEVLKSENIILRSKVKSLSGSSAEDGVALSSLNFKGESEYEFSFKITKVEKGYLKEGEVLHFKYVDKGYSCPSIQKPTKSENWQLNIADVDSDNNAKAYGLYCSRLGFKINK